MAGSRLLFSEGKQSADQIAAVKAAELGRAVIDEVLGRNFDHNSGPNGGLPECVFVRRIRGDLYHISRFRPGNGFGRITTRCIMMLMILMALMVARECAGRDLK